MQWSNTVMSKPLQVKTYIYQWSHFSLMIQFPHILQVLHHKRRMWMILKVGLRDGNRELGAFRGVTRLVVDGNQGRGDVCAFPFDIRSQWYLPKLRIIPNNPEAENICVIRTRYLYFLSINTVVIIAHLDDLCLDHLVSAHSNRETGTAMYYQYLHSSPSWFILNKPAMLWAPLQW